MPFATAIKHISINYYTPFKIYGESFIFQHKEKPQLIMIYECNTLMCGFGVSANVGWLFAHTWDLSVRVTTETHSFS